MCVVSSSSSSATTGCGHQVTDRQKKPRSVSLVTTTKSSSSSVQEEAGGGGETQASLLAEVDRTLARVLRQFLPETRGGLLPQDRLRDALEREPDLRSRREMLRVHSDGLATEIVERMALLRSMRVVERLHAVFGETMRTTATHRELRALRERASSMSAELDDQRRACEAAEARASLLTETVARWRRKHEDAEDALRRARGETERVRARAAQREAKLKQELEDARVEACVAQNRRASPCSSTSTTKKEKEEDPGPDTIEDRQKSLEEVLKLSLYCCEATRHWVEQTEENNWAARTIQTLTRELHLAEARNWHLLAHVADTFGHMTSSVVDTETQDAFHLPFDEKNWKGLTRDLQQRTEILLWGRSVAMKDVIRQRTFNVRFHVRGFTALSSYVVDWMQHLEEDEKNRTDGRADDDRLAPLRQWHDLIQHQLSGMMHVSPTNPTTSSMVELVLEPLRRAVRRFRHSVKAPPPPLDTATAAAVVVAEEGKPATTTTTKTTFARRDFYADVFWHNLHRWNVLDLLAYQTTGSRDTVVHAWLVQLLTSAAIAVAGKASWYADAGLALLYQFQTSDSAPVTTFSHYRVGLRMEHTLWDSVTTNDDERCGRPKTSTVEAWLPMAFTSFLSVLNIVDYLDDYVHPAPVNPTGKGPQQAKPALQILVRAKEITLTAKPHQQEVRLKRMRGGTGLVKDPDFGEERVLRFLDPDWLTEACFFFVHPPIKECACLVRGEDGSSASIRIVGGMLAPRCDHAWMHTVGWCNYAFAGTPTTNADSRFPLTASGSVSLAETRLTASHVRWMRRKYLSLNNLAEMMSEDTLLSTVMHFL